MNSDIQSAPVQIKAKKRSFFRYIQELKDELKKVSWTSKAELKVSVKAVVISTFLFGLGIYLTDLVIKAGLQGIGVLARWIFG